MGKPRGGKNNNKRGGKRGGGQQGERDSRQGGAYAATVKSNPAFESYYKAQGILPEDEFEAMMQAYREDLPTTFRVTGSRAHAHDLNNVIHRTYVPYLSGITFERQLLDPPKPLSWYPNGLAWQVNVGKSAIRRSIEFKKFQEFLVYETEAGNLSRQEAVSMIPPLLLDVQPHHYGLDLCAAPGSKSVQILEALHAAPNPTGLFIANDSDSKRCHMLVHQSLGRIGSPSMLVTNQDASMYISMKKSDPTTGKPTALKFDRILADVPCSGDATLRKNMAVWERWSTGDGIGLHPLQLRILLRGIQSLKAGGRLVYSTCSMNPIENEAVVSAALSLHPDMSLIDMSDQLPLLKRKSGLTTWKVMNKDEEVPKGTESWELDGKKKKCPPTLWPAGDEEAKNLSRCLRLYPHMQDTGGFFVAVLQKAADVSKAPTPAAEPSSAVKRTLEEADAVEAAPAATEPPTDTMSNEPVSAPAKTEEDASDERPTKRAKVDASSESKEEKPSSEVKEEKKPEEQKQPPKKQSSGPGLPFKEEPFIYLAPDNEQVQACVDFFHLSPEFDRNNLLVRNKDGLPKRSIYVTSSSVRDMIEHNDYARARIISAGVRAFTRQEGGKNESIYPCKWRIVNEGVPLLQHFVGPERVIKTGLKSLELLLKEMYPAIESFEQDFQERVSPLDPGSYIVEVGPDPEANVEQAMYLPMWRAPVTTNLMVEKNEKSALALRVFGSDITGLIDSKKQKTGRHQNASAGSTSAGPTPAETPTPAAEEPTTTNEAPQQG